MIKKLLLLVWLLPLTAYSQTITVDDTSNTPTDLVNLLLGNSCTDVSNIQISSSQSVAYFNNNASVFPINEGIIIRSGIARHSEGTYTGNNLDSQQNTQGDPGLQNIINNLGQSGNITDVAFLQFDFIPLSSNFSFDFLFASNEYGQWQCASFDTFAFFLTDLATNTTTNLAVIPNTNTPVSVLNIRDQAFNGNCLSSNQSLFSTYNVSNPSASTLNMRGHTNVMNASAAVVPNNTYRIRLIIGDYQDFRYDSAVFLASGSFITTLDLGPDTTICSGDSTTITTGLSNTDFNHSWTRNGNPLTETSNTLTVTQNGIYEVTATKIGTSCVITDQIEFTDLSVSNPTDLIACNSGSANYNYDLSRNNELTLGIDDVVYDIEYYTSIADATAHINAIPQAQWNNYSSSGNETIYLALLNTNSGNFCDAIYSFDLLIDTPITINPIGTIENCDSPSGLTVDLVNHILTSNPQLSPNYNLLFYATQTEAQTGGSGNFSNPNNYAVTTGVGTQTIWMRAESSANSLCFEVANFDITIHPLPLIDTLADVIECQDYTLPVITNGNYFSGPNGTGTAYNAGDIIDIGGTYFIFNGPDVNGCSNESSFQITLIDDYAIPLEHCGEFIVPAPPAGAFYEQTGGPTNASNIVIPSGTIITSNQTIYFYADVNGSFCKEEAFPLIIHPLPPVDTLTDVTTCVSYNLQPLTNGSYFDASGNPLNVGDAITSTQVITIMNGPDINGCTDQSTFTIFIINNVGNQISCGSYTLPNLDAGNYYTGPTGTGTLIPAQTVITTSQTIYIYANTSTAPNCTDNMSFIVDILPVPPVDTLADVTECELFILPTLTNGNYFTAPNGGGTMLNAGDIIDLNGANLPGTYYIYTPANSVGCDNQSSFNATINPLPLVDTVGDLYFCAPYSLPDPINGDYFTEPNGAGTLVTPSMVFDETQMFYIYNIEPSTGCFVNIPFTAYYNFIGLPDYDNEIGCDSFTLQTLTHSAPYPDNYTINYYSQSGGNAVDLISPSNYTLTNTQTVYVFASNGDRFPCTEEKSFTVTISETPDLNSYAVNFASLDGTNHCGSFTLPTLTPTTYTLNYYSQAGGNASDIINPSNYTYSVSPGTTSQTFTVWIYATAADNTNCSDETQFQFTVYPLSTFNVEDGIICVHPQTGVVENTTTLQVIQNGNFNPTNYNIEWYLNNILMGNGFQYVADQIGTYTIVPIRLTPENAPDCSYAPTTATVTQSSVAVAEVVLTDSFEEVAIATVVINNGFGTYEYQLDDGNFQSNNQFYNVSSGDHTITVNDINGNCGDTVISFTVIKYPKFFTPNGDGYNDRWNIFDLEDDGTANISIFDRYGKLIKQISPSGSGWDGTFNGTPLPSTDYWFVVDYTYNNQKRKFRAHFTMKR